MKWFAMMKTKSRPVGSWLLLLLFGAALLLMLLLPLTAFALTPEEQTLKQAYEDGQIIRLHILAEDDSPRAQAIKLAVRDSLLQAFGQEIAEAGAADADEVYALLVQRREQMLSVARETAYSLGYEGPVTAQVGWMTLPEKTYGGLSLPAGEYRALRIILGDGEGQNWWCVLFPQLCLALATEEPWQTRPRQPVELSEIQWHSMDILRRWTLIPPAETP